MSLPASILGQEVCGEDVDATGLVWIVEMEICEPGLSVERLNRARQHPASRGDADFAL